MTTVACDGKHLAVDSMLSGRYVSTGFSKVKKVIWHGENGLIAWTGQADYQEAFIEALSAGHWPSYIDRDDAESPFEGWLVRAGQPIKAWFGTRYSIDLPGFPQAIGSGSEFAMGAMLAGASVVRAVEIACALDEGTSAPVMVYSLDTMELVPRLTAAVTA